VRVHIGTSSAIMVGGGLLSWLVLIPAIALFGEGRLAPLYPATALISDMSPDELWSRYIRYIGAGAVAAGGIINLAKALPTIIDSFRASFRDLRLTAAGSGDTRPRTERDIPSSVVLVGSVAWRSSWRSRPTVPCSRQPLVGGDDHRLALLLGPRRTSPGAGSSSNPVSGMPSPRRGRLIHHPAGPPRTWPRRFIDRIRIASSNAGTTRQTRRRALVADSGGSRWRSSSGDCRSRSGGRSRSQSTMQRPGARRGGADIAWARLTPAPTALPARSRGGSTRS
jgi:hypothetical protein